MLSLRPMKYNLEQCTSTSQPKLGSYLVVLRCTDLCNNFHLSCPLSDQGRRGVQKECELPPELHCETDTILTQILCVVWKVFEVVLTPLIARKLKSSLRNWTQIRVEMYSIWH